MKNIILEWNKFISIEEFYEGSFEELTTSRKDCLGHTIFREDSVRLDEIWSSQFGISLAWLLRHASSSIATPDSTNSKSLKPSGNTHLCSLNDVTVFSPGHEIYVHSEGKFISPRSRRVVNSGLDATHRVNNELYYQLSFCEQVLYIDEPVFLLSSRWSSHNFYHWIIDCIPKIIQYKRLVKYMSGLKILLLEDHGKPFHFDFFNGAGVGESDIIRAFGKSVFAKRLFHMPRIGPDSHSTDLNNELAKILAPMKSQYIAAPSKIYIARKKNRERSIQNSDELELTLKKLGFSIVFLEDYSLADQIALIDNAEIIIGPHGAGLTLTAVNFPETKNKFVIEITHVHPFNPCFFYNSLARKISNHIILPSQIILHNRLSLINVDAKMLEVVVEASISEL